MSEPETRIQKIMRLENEADAAEQSANDMRWEAAETIWQELQAGTTQRKLASEIGKSQAHVAKCNRIWADHRSDSPENRPKWADAYRKVSSKPEDKPATAPLPDSTKLKPEPEAKAKAAGNRETATETIKPPCRMCGHPMSKAEAARAAEFTAVNA